MDTASGVVWRPLLDGAEREQALSVASEIGRVVCAPDAEGDDPSASSGAAGNALLGAYLELALPGAGHGDAALGCLDRAIDIMGARAAAPSLYGGFTGVAWVMEHLAGRLCAATPDDEDGNAESDEALAGFLAHSPWKLDYDLIIGLVGLGVYALERLPRPSSATLVELVVDRLAETAVRPWQGEGWTWWTAPELLIEPTRAEYPDGYYNLGLAHGVPGVIGLLAGACACGVAREKARPLLDGAVTWVLGQRLPDGGFASYAGPGIKPHASRQAWCYGDPGVGIALLVAARAVGEPGWEASARDILLRASTVSMERSRVVDAGLCHGAAGLAHIYNRAWQMTGEVALAEAARVWLGRTLAMRQPGEGVAGYSSWRPSFGGAKAAWTPDGGLLTGAGGIALMLAAAAAPVAPDWDRFFLTSVVSSVRTHG